MGICAFVIKPLDKTDLAISIRKVLDEVKSKVEKILQ